MNNNEINSMIEEYIKLSAELNGLHFFFNEENEKYKRIEILYAMKDILYNMNKKIEAQDLILQDELKNIKNKISLKIYPKYFQAVLEGKKTFEIRKNDRNYQVGNILNLKEYFLDTYTGREQKVKVTYILNNETYLQPNYICMGIEKVGEQ